MPLPLILGIGAAVLGVTGVTTGGFGVKKFVDANTEMKEIKKAHDANLERFEITSKSTAMMMDDLGTQELEICQSFKRFSELFEKVKNKPEFAEYKQEGLTIPTYEAEELKKVYVGAGVLVGGLGGAAVGTAGGFAAAGATTAAVMALGTASTGTAIASLSGVAATNATLSSQQNERSKAMKKIIPYEKLSKKRQRELNAKKRQDWGGMNPVTRQPEKPKAYSRRKAQRWKEDSSFEPFDFMSILYLQYFPYFLVISSASSARAFPLSTSFTFVAMRTPLAVIMAQVLVKNC